MKTYARIEADIVVELFQTDGNIAEMFHPDLIWVDVTHVAGIAERWVRVGGDFLPPAAPPPPTDDELAADVRAARDGKLLATNWMVERHQEQLAAGIETTLSAAGFSSLLAYRQALRDVPGQTGFPEAVEWPAEPWIL